MQERPFKDEVQRSQKQRKFTRRDFIKTSVATTAVVAGAGIFGAQLLTHHSTHAAGVDIWNLPAFTPASGPFQPDWNNIAQQYRVPTWFRDAKFGIWQHWDPQSVPEYGDWYAHGMYQQGSSQYNYHLAHYGHPSQFGYKDIVHLFTASQWNPDALMQLYVQQGGAKYFVGLANHHDNFDNWNSTYQPWNSTVVGPKKDIIGLWSQSAKKYGVPFGVTVHACPGPSWDVFMPVRYGSDSSGSLAGVHYDGWTTAADGTGKWWQGMDPVALNGPVHQADSNYVHSDSSPFVRQFYYRTDDLITKYQPDLLYFDNGLATPSDDWSMPDQAKVMAANYYNKSLQWHGGQLNVALNLKLVPSNWQGALVADLERTTSTTIQNYAWQTDTSLGDWHYYAPNPITMTAPQVIQELVSIVSNNGNLLLNVPQHGDGHLDQQAIQIVQDVGTWLGVNGEAIYGTRPFAVSTEGSVSYTRKGNVVYAIALSWPQNNTLILTTLNSTSPYVGNVTQVQLLGHAGNLGFTQNSSSLTINAPSGQASSAAYAFKITHNKVLFNNDDGGYYSGPGWYALANRGLGDSNNNVWATTNNGDSVSYTFTGVGIQYITEINGDEGNVDVYIDGTYQKTVSAYSSARKVQVVLYSKLNLSSGQHTIKLVKTSGSYMLLDSFKVFPTTNVNIINRNSGLAMDVSGANTAAGTTVIQWPSTGGANQKWQLIDGGNGYYTIKNLNSGLVLDISGASTATGGSLIQWNSTGGNNQQWQLVDTGGGYTTIVNRNSGLVLDVTGASTANGTAIIQWTSSGSPNQQWQIVPA